MKAGLSLSVSNNHKALGTEPTEAEAFVSALAAVLHLAAPPPAHDEVPRNDSGNPVAPAGEDSPFSTSPRAEAPRTMMPPADDAVPGATGPVGVPYLGQPDLSDEYLAPALLLPEQLTAAAEASSVYRLASVVPMTPTRAGALPSAPQSTGTTTWSAPTLSTPTTSTATSSTSTPSTPTESTPTSSTPTPSAVSLPGASASYFSGGNADATEAAFSAPHTNDAATNDSESDLSGASPAKGESADPAPPREAIRRADVNAASARAHTQTPHGSRAAPQQMAAADAQPTQTTTVHDIGSGSESAKGPPPPNPEGATLSPLRKSAAEFAATGLPRPAPEGQTRRTPSFSAPHARLDSADPVVAPPRLGSATASAQGTPAQPAGQTPAGDITAATDGAADAATTVEGQNHGPEEATVSFQSHGQTSETPVGASEGDTTSSPSRLLEQMRRSFPSADVRIVRGSQGETLVSMKHPTFGAVELNLQMTQAGLDVAARVDGAHAAGLLRRSESTLRKSIHRRGLSLGRLRVERNEKHTSRRRLRGIDLEA